MSPKSSASSFLSSASSFSSAGPGKKNRPKLKPIGPQGAPAAGGERLSPKEKRGLAVMKSKKKKHLKLLMSKLPRLDELEIKMYVF